MEQEEELFSGSDRVCAHVRVRARVGFALWCVQRAKNLSHTEKRENWVRERTAHPSRLAAEDW